jgi:hypothetical protein
MKRLVLILSLVIGASMLSPTSEAQARSSSGQSQKVKKGKQGKRGKQTRAGVPELDPSAAGSAIVLLLGGAAYIASRRREQDLA